MGLCYANMGQGNLAEQTLKKAVEVNPKMVSARMALARIYLSERQADLVREVLQPHRGRRDT